MGTPWQAIWETYEENAFLKLGWEKVTSWECFYFHGAKQLFLSCYVDDFRMAGKKENVAPMWDSLRKEGIDLGPPVPLKQNVYLGCGQKVIEPNMALISQKREMFQRICHFSAFGKPTSTAGRDPLKEASPADS